MTDIQKLKELARKATPGTRFVNTMAGPNRTEVFSGNVLICDTITGTQDRFEGLSPEADAAFIAACSPDMILGLIKRVADYEVLIEAVANDRDDCVSPGFKKAAAELLTASRKKD